MDSWTCLLPFIEASVTAAETRASFRCRLSIADCRLCNLQSAIESLPLARARGSRLASSLPLRDRAEAGHDLAEDTADVLAQGRGHGDADRGNDRDQQAVLDQR